MKKALITAAALALVTVGAIAAYKLALAYKVADIISDEAAEDLRQQFMTGAYADYREVIGLDTYFYTFLIFFAPETHTSFPKHPPATRHP